MTRLPHSAQRPLRVSVVIPAYACEDTIEKSLESVLAQSYAPYEVIVVDDGSPRDLAPLLKRFQNSIRFVRQVNGGASKARNRGVTMSQGDLIAFLDADDLWDPTKLEKSVAIFRDHENVHLVATRYEIQDASTKTVKTSGPLARHCNHPIHSCEKLAFDFARHISTPTVMIRKCQFDQNRFDSSLATAEDRDLWFRILRKNACYFLSEALTTVVVRDNSLSNKDLDGDSRCMLEVIGRYSHQIGFLKSHRERAYVHYKWATGHGRGRSAWLHLMQSFRHWPLPFSRIRTPCHLARLRFAVGLSFRGVLARRLLTRRAEA